MLSIAADRPVISARIENVSNATDRYGLEREQPGARRGGGWMVRLRRQGRVVARLFKDTVHGSSDAALEQARAYRDAVVAALPPRTNHEQARQLRRNNKSGISGVHYVELRDDAFWLAHLTTTAGLRRARFAIGEYGEARAKEMAIAQRRRWLEELPASFLTANPQAQKASRRAFAPRLQRPVDVMPLETLPDAEFDERLALVNTRFDALRPKRLKVRVRSYEQGRLSVAVSDAGRPARRRLMQIRARNRSEIDLLHEVSDKIVSTVTELYGAPTAEWFMREHGRNLLDPARFDPCTGFNICVFLPT